MTYDLVIRGGNVVDGTGLPGYTADVAVQRRPDRRDRPRRGDGASRVVDADGLVVAPGFIDVHTHYDVQLDWDPVASPAMQHGVTTVLTGNCGFTLDPAKPEDVDWLAGMLTRVEGMSREAMREGFRFSGGGFADYWRRLEGKLALNVGGYVGPLRGAALRDGRRRLRARGHARRDRGDEGARARGDARGRGRLLHLAARHPRRRRRPRRAVELRRARGDHRALLGARGVSVRRDRDHPAQPRDRARRRRPRAALRDRARVGQAGRDRPARPDARRADGLAAHARVRARGARAGRADPPAVHLAAARAAPAARRHVRVRRDAGAGSARSRASIAERCRKLADPRAARRGCATSSRASTRAAPFPIEILEVEHVRDAANRALVGRSSVELAAERGGDALDAFLDVSIAEDLATGWRTRPESRPRRSSSPTSCARRCSSRS